MPRPKQSSQIRINDRKVAQQKREEIDHLLAMERKRMFWFEYLCVNKTLPNKIINA